MELLEQLIEGFRRALGTPADAALRRYVQEGRGPLPGRARLLHWDANSIHDFVFNTTNAIGIRGASRLLTEVDDALRAGTVLGLDPTQILFSGGGGGMAVVSEEKAEAARDRLHRFYAEKTLVATCTAAVIDLAAETEGFGQRVAAIGRELVQERCFTSPDAEPSVPFFVQRCGVCGRRAAAGMVNRRGCDRAECEPCRCSIERGKSDVYTGEEADDYEKIARNGAFAVLYLDGNGVGKTLASLESPFAWARFSHAIASTVDMAFKATASTYGLREESTEKGPARGTYQRPICGGDDVVAIVPGDVAVPFARDLARAIELAADADPDLERVRLGAAVGVAIGKVTFPVRHLLEEAEELLRRAKRRVYRDGERSAIDFSVVRDGAPRSESLIPARWTTTEATPMLPSGRPYGLGEFEQFSQRFEKFRAAKIGRSQLHALRRYAEAGPQQLRNHVLYQVARHTEWRRLLDEIATDQQLAGDAKERYFSALVPTYGQRWVFDIGDMIELDRHWPSSKERVLS